MFKTPSCSVDTCVEIIAICHLYDIQVLLLYMDIVVLDDVIFDTVHKS